jgi:hypothetical protein
MTDKLKPKPVGSRPRCLFCNKELRPNYGYDVERPWFAEDYDGSKRKRFEREHKIFKGTYGVYASNRFCRLNCGYDYAVAHTKPKV